MNLTTVPLQVEMPVRIQREQQLGVKRNLLLLDRSLPVQLKVQQKVELSNRNIL